VSTVGNVAVSPEAASNEFNSVLSEESAVPAFTRISDVVHEAGSAAGIQLAHSVPNLSPSRKWKAENPEAEISRLRSIICWIPVDFIGQSLSAFVRAARLANRANFDVVQIHAAHGYLRSLLMTPKINRRTDQFAYYESWLMDFVQRLRDAVHHRWLSFRINARPLQNKGNRDEDEAVRLACRLVAAGVDVIDLSGGLYTVDRNLIYPGDHSAKPPYLDVAIEVSNQTGAITSFAGRAQRMMAFLKFVGPLHLISLGRALIADPKFAKKWKRGQLEDIVHCDLKGHCHYFTRDKPGLACGVNSDI